MTHLLLSTWVVPFLSSLFLFCHSANAAVKEAQCGVIVGDRSEFDREILAARPSLHKIGRVSLHLTEDQVEDYVQEAIQRALEGYQKGQFRPGSSAKNYLYESLNNLKTDKWRRAQFRKQVELDAMIEEKNFQLAEDLPFGFTRQIAHIETMELAALFHQLPVKLRRALYLYYFEELSMDEASHMMGLSVMAFRHLLQRGRERLKELAQRAELSSSESQLLEPQKGGRSKKKPPVEGGVYEFGRLTLDMGKGELLIEQKSYRVAPFIAVFLKACLSSPTRKLAKGEALDLYTGLGLVKNGNKMNERLRGFNALIFSSTGVPEAIEIIKNDGHRLSTRFIEFLDLK